MNKPDFQKLLPAWLFDFLKGIESQIQKRDWEKKGKPLPPVHPIKQDVVTYFQKQTGYKVLIETGTYKGQMIYAQHKRFKTIHSVELAEHYYNSAVERFRKFPHIKLWLGDSSDVLPTILADLNESAVFWLDGHYSGGLTAGGEPGQKQCPIYNELEAIFSHDKKHCILIDDARCFVGKDDYPSIDELKAFLDSKNRDYSFDNCRDIIRINML